MATPSVSLVRTIDESVTQLSHHSCWAQPKPINPVNLAQKAKEGLRRFKPCALVGQEITIITSEEAMNASFYSLFRRGKYGSLRPGIGLKGDRIPHEERERFVAAALGFTLLHSKPFRRWFLTEILQLPRHYHNSKPEITMDENQWADVKLADDGTHSFLCVVEVKTGASLDMHQDAENDEFWESGYGRELRNQKTQRGGQVGYCVLDISQRPPPKMRHGIKCFARRWHEVAAKAPQSDTIVKDFLALLIYIVLPLSTANNSPLMKTNSLPLANICRLHNELEAIAVEYGFKIRSQEKVGTINDASFGTAFGFKKGTRLVGRPTVTLRGWFGWHIADKKLNCEVWFYCSPSKGTGELLLKHLKRAKFSCPTHRDCVFATKAASDLSDDVRWLRSIFAGLLK